MKMHHSAMIALVPVLIVSLIAMADDCLVPDNGAGTAVFPPNCPNGYQGPMHIVNGLPPGSPININAQLGNFNVMNSGPGGSLGGEFQQSMAMMQMQMTGTGSLAGYNRMVFIQVQCETHIGPRTPGQPVQSFPSDIFMMQGQLPPGDPDFDLLRITAGNAFGMPSPGHTTLIQQITGWNVDSFFDTTYRIDFVGAPGGPLAGMSGSTNDQSHMAIKTPTPKIDAWVTSDGCGGNTQALPPNGSPPIPPDFFGPGSDPFQGQVCYAGEPLGATPFGTFDVADTIIRRPAGDPFDHATVPGAEIDIPIEIVALNLVSASPITVTYFGGAFSEQWNVQVDLSQLPAPMGSMTATKTHANGGTFDAAFHVQPRFTFTNVDQPGEVRVLDTGAEGIPPIIFVATENMPWVHDLDPDIQLESPCCTDFHPGIQDPGQPIDTVGGQSLVPVVWSAPGALHTMRRPLLPNPCPADIAPPGGNGSVGTADLLALINSWGACAGCPADIAPPGGNGSVGTPDLLALINAWGLCP